MNVLDKLNKEFLIEVKDGIAYDMQDVGEIIATNKQDLIQFYIDCFNYKMEMVSDDEVETKNHYTNIIEQLKELV